MEKDSDLAHEFQRAVGKPLRTGVSLRDYSSFRIGGAADYFFEASSTGELAAALAFARGKIPCYVIGGGYNILFADAGFRGLIIRNRAEGVSGGIEEGRVIVDSGTPIARIVQFAVAGSIGGLEFLAGIPGTAGGALSSNAGAFGQCIGDRVLEASVVDEKGEKIILAKSGLELGYRDSRFRRKRETVLGIVLDARKGDRVASSARISDYLEKRRERHPPWSVASAGSFFKNPTSPDGSKIPAGRLLQDVGAGDIRIGGASVFQGHCNFIINTGNARAGDILRLAAELKERVKARFGILLEEEVICLGESSPGL